MRPRPDFTPNLRHSAATVRRVCARSRHCGAGLTESAVPFGGNRGNAHQRRPACQERGRGPAPDAARACASVCPTRNSSWSTTAPPTTPPRSPPQHGARVLSSPVLDGQRRGHQARRPRGHAARCSCSWTPTASTTRRTIPQLLDTLDEGYDMVVGARDCGGQANVGRGAGQRLLQPARELDDRPPHRRPDLRIPRRARRQVPRVPAPAAERLLLPDHHARWRSSAAPIRSPTCRSRSRTRIGTQPHPAAARRRALPADHLQDRHAVLAAEAVRAGGAGVLRCWALGYYAYTFVDRAAASPT